MKCPLLDGDAFGEVAGFIHVATELDRDVVGEELQRNHRKDGGEVVRAIGNEDHVVADFCERGVAFRSDRNDGAFARFDFLDVADVFFEDRISRSDEDRGGFLGDESDDAVFEFCARIAGRGNVADLFELEGALQGDRVLRLAAHKKEAFRVGVFFRNRGDLRIEEEGSCDEIR